MAVVMGLVLTLLGCWMQSSFVDGVFGVELHPVNRRARYQHKGRCKSSTSKGVQRHR